MKTVKNLFKSKKKRSRLNSIELALKTNVGAKDIVEVAKRIDNYINEGL